MLTCRCDRSSTPCAISEIREDVSQVFSERVCVGYSRMMHAYAGRYHKRLHPLLSDAQSRGAYAVGYHISIGKDGYSLYIDEATSDEERGTAHLLSRVAMMIYSRLFFPFQILLRRSSFVFC